LKIYPVYRKLLSVNTSNAQEKQKETNKLDESMDNFMFNYTNFIKKHFLSLCLSVNISFKGREFFNKRDTSIFDINIITKFASQTEEPGPAMYIKYEFNFITC
jgi:hypothetical protein